MPDRRMNLHLVRNAVSHDSRVLKETASLRACGRFSAVEIAGIAGRGRPEREPLEGTPVWRVPLRSRGLRKDLLSQSFKLLEWGGRIVSAYAKAPLGVIHCHDLEPLPVGAVLKRLTGARLVYDAHELETERAGHGSLRKSLMRRVERHLMKSVDAMITVSPSIRDWYASRYPDLPISLVRNVPHRSQSTVQPGDLKSRLRIPGDALLFIYLGGLSHGRGIEHMLQAFGDPTVLHHLVVIGNGPLQGAVDAACAASPRIHRLPPVAPGQVLEIATGADVGVCLYEDTCLNHRYCLPNKLFEYLLAGLPVLVSRLPDMGRLVGGLGAGWQTDNDVASIVRTLLEITHATLAQLRARLADRTRELGWHAEVPALMEAYDRATSRA